MLRSKDPIKKKKQLATYVHVLLQSLLNDSKDVIQQEYYLRPQNIFRILRFTLRKVKWHAFRSLLTNAPACEMFYGFKNVWCPYVHH